ncbi:MAG: hypothetical protein C0392_13435, partial [Syntrophus sp. (in: bacteria)]|nr:hypothetical protein [Syntrophus sp. (in: bacteria)]
IFFNIDRIVDEVVLVNKIFVPESNDSPANRAFNECDLLIVKGTGNYDAFRGEKYRGKTAIFLLKIKCEPVAEDMGVEEGRFIVKVAQYD